ncbi:MAG: hypothetical protein IMZ71_02805 [Chloroflexi bacterium]|nr:hypothetical protein [Chloroflexota bacterium]
MTTGNLTENLKKLTALDQPEIRLALEVSAANVVKHMQMNHRRPATTAERIGHPDPRFYTWTGKLVNSMRAGAVKVGFKVMSIEVKAGDRSTNYAADVEFGTPHSRQFPFFRPALAETAKVNMEMIGSSIRKALRRMAQEARGPSSV